MDASRPTSELAADVRFALDGTWHPVREDGTRAVRPTVDKAHTSLDALVARITDLEAQVAALTNQEKRLGIAVRDLERANDKLRAENRSLRRSVGRADA